jgi:hypothetical protein
MASERCFAIALTVLWCSVPGAAWGDGPTAAEKETARGMMDSGHARRDAGDHKGALELFQGADSIMHVPVTGIEVAREQVALGHLVEARDTLQVVLRLPAENGEPEVFRAARKDASTLDDSLVKRIPALQITVSGNAAQVILDGRPVPLPALVAPFKVDPGHHVVVAMAEGGEPKKEVGVDVGEGETRSVELTLPERTEAPPQASQDNAGTAAHEGAAPTAPSGSAVPWLRWGGVGLAAVGIGAGTITGLIAISSKSSADKGCVNNMCPPSTWSDVNSARTTSTLSTIAFSVGGGGVVLAVISYLIAPAKPQASSTGTQGATFAPWLGLGSAGFSGAF